MLSQKMQDAINDQIQKEIYSSYLYLAMAAHAEAENLPGFANWMYLQSKEERAHAMKFFHHVNERGGRVVLQAIEQPQLEWASPLAMFQGVLEHERFVTASIHRLYELAVEEKDYPAQVMLHWFIDEQVEEEANASQIVDLLEKVGDKMQALIMLDRQLGSRGAG